MKERLLDVPNASDEAIEHLAMKWLNEGAGEKYFAFMAALVSCPVDVDVDVCRCIG